MNDKLIPYGNFTPDDVQKKYTTGEFTIDDVRNYHLYHTLKKKDMYEMSPDEVSFGYKQGVFSFDNVKDYHAHHTDKNWWEWKDIFRAGTYAVRDFVQETHDFAENIIRSVPEWMRPGLLMKMKPVEEEVQGSDLPKEILGIDRPHSIIGKIGEEFGQEALGMILPMTKLNKMVKAGNFLKWAASHPKLARLVVTNIAGAWAAGTARNPFDPTFVDVIDAWVNPEHEWSGPVMDFLKSDEDRPELLARVSHALQESFAGTITDSLLSVMMKSLRWTKSLLKARAGGHIDDVVEEAVNAPRQMEFDFTKKVEQPKPTKAPKPEVQPEVKVKPEVAPEKQAVEARVSLSSQQLSKMGKKMLDQIKGVADVEPTQVINKGYIDWDSATHPENLSNLMDTMGDMLKRKVSRIKGGARVTHEETIAAARQKVGEVADALGVDPDKHWDYWNNRAANLRESYAEMATEVQMHRDLLVTYGDYIGKLVDDLDMSDAEQVVRAFTHFQRYYEMMGSMMGVSSEIGRGLNIHKALSQSLGLDPTEFSRFAKTAGGETIADMQNALKGFIKQRSVVDKTAYVRNVMKLSYGRAILTYRQAQLVFSPLTLARNLVSNSAALAWKTLGRTIAAPGRTVLDAVTGKGINLHHMKATGNFYMGLMGGLVDAFRLPTKNWGSVWKHLRDFNFKEVADAEVWKDFGTAWKSFKTGKPTTDAFGKITNVEDLQMLMKKIPVLGKPLYTTLTASFKALAATDEVFAAMAVNAEKRHLSYLRSWDEVTGMIKSGKVKAYDFDKLFRQKLTKRLVEPDKDIFEQAIRMKRDITFTEDLGKWSTDFFRLLSPRFGGGFMGRNFPPMLRMVTMPFINVAVNMWKWAFRMIPGVGALTPRFMADMAAGGTRAADALASQAMSVGFGAGIFALVENNLITGKLPKSARQAGVQDYSINASVFGGDPNEWISYKEFAPFSMTIGLMVDCINWWTLADAKEPMKIESEEAHPAEEAMYGLLSLFSENLLSGSFVTGLRDISEIIMDPEKNKNLAKQFGVRFAATMAPMSMALQYMQRQIDPYYREINDWEDALSMNNPWTDELYAKRDPITGAPVSRKEMAWFLAMTSKQTDQPGLQEVFLSGLPVSDMRKAMKQFGVSAELTNDQFQELNDILMEMPVLERLNKEVKKASYQRSTSDFYNAQRLSKIITHYKGKARHVFLKRHPELKKAMKGVRSQERSARRGKGVSQDPDIKAFKGLIRKE